MGLMEAILEGSSIIQEIKEEAREEGRAEGRAEGLVEVRCALRTVLKPKFPGLEMMPEIDNIDSMKILRSVLELEVVSSDRSEVQRAIWSATPQK